MQAMRYDTVPLKATSTAEGFISDTPVLTRVGIFPYRAPDGSTRYEYRPADEVFHADSLASLKGKPITDGHAQGGVTARNARQLTVGTVLSPGRQDGENVLADIIIHDPSPVTAGKKDLSLGYAVELDETPGEWNGQRYDAVQRHIRVNHLALVRRGRAGNARLNLDAADAVDDDEENSMSTVKVRLDSGLQYDAAPEVAQEVEALRTRLEAQTKRADTEQARADSEKSRADTATADIEKARKDGKDAALARVKLEADAKAMGVTVTDAMSDKDLRVAGIKAVRGDAFELAGKSDSYIEVAFDLALGERKARADALGQQRRDMNPPPQGKGGNGDARGDSKDEPAPGAKSAAEARARMIAAQQKRV